MIPYPHQKCGDRDNHAHTWQVRLLTQSRKQKFEKVQRSSQSRTHMTRGAVGWLRSVGSIKLYVSFAEYVSFIGLFCRRDLHFNRCYEPKPPHIDAIKDWRTKLTYCKHKNEHVAPSSFSHRTHQTHNSINPHTNRMFPLFLTSTACPHTKKKHTLHNDLSSFFFFSFSCRHSLLLLPRICPLQKSLLLSFLLWQIPLKMLHPWNPPRYTVKLNQNLHLNLYCKIPRNLSNFWETATHDNIHPDTATHCDILQHVTTYSKKLQHTAPHCSTHALLTSTAHNTHTYARTLTRIHKVQHTATHCSTLQHTATHCNTLQHTAAHCSKHTLLTSPAHDIHTYMRTLEQKHKVTLSGATS